MNQSKKIKLHGGSWNGHDVAYVSGERIPMVISEGFKRDSKGRPVAEEGMRVGVAIYEVNEDRTEAFFLTNEWKGTKLRRPS